MKKATSVGVEDDFESLKNVSATPKNVKVGGGPETQIRMFDQNFIEMRSDENENLASSPISSVDTTILTSSAAKSEKKKAKTRYQESTKVPQTQRSTKKQSSPTKSDFSGMSKDTSPNKFKNRKASGPTKFVSKFEVSKSGVESPIKRVIPKILKSKNLTKPTIKDSNRQNSISELEKLILGNIKDSTNSILKRIPPKSTFIRKVSNSPPPKFTLQLEQCPSGSSNEKTSVWKSYQSQEQEPALHSLFLLNDETPFHGQD